MSTSAANRRVLPLRFVDGDSIRAPRGAIWRRGLRTPGKWEEFPLAEKAGARGDEEMRALLDGQEGWLFIPFLPPVTAALPGTVCTSTEQVRSLRLAPATGVALYAARLSRAQSFFGNDQGAFQDLAHPALLRPTDMRATLEGVLTRRPSAKISCHRFGGRAYARYATGSTLHTHIHLFTC